MKGILIWCFVIFVFTCAALVGARRWLDGEHEKDKERRKWREQGPP